VSVGAVLVNPNNPNADSLTRNARETALSLGLQLHIFNGVRDLASPSEMGMLGAIQAVMPAFSMPFTIVGGRDAAEFERAIEMFAREPNGGMIILPSPNTLVHRRVIMDLAARHRLPAIYPYGFFAREDGLTSYGIVPSDNLRRKRSPSLATQRYSIRRSRPSSHPSSRSPLSNAATRGCASGSSAAIDISATIRRPRPPCCALAARGHAAVAPQSRVMKSRRLMGLTPRPRITDGV